MRLKPVKTLYEVLVNSDFLDREIPEPFPRINFDLTLKAPRYFVALFAVDDAGVHQFRYINSATIPATMPAMTKRHPSFVMQLMIVNGSRASFNAKLKGQNSSLNSANTI